jgi:hypothetical protein
MGVTAGRATHVATGEMKRKVTVQGQELAIES